MGIASADFGIMNQLLTRNSVFVRYWRKNRSIIEQCISYL